MTGGGHLDRFYDTPSSVLARLVGGPFDGEERPFPVALLESMVVAHLEVPMPLSPGLLLADAAGPPRRLGRASYQARRDGHGFFSRDDEGRVRFDFWGIR